MSEHPWDWFSVFLASAAISSLYYIANPSDHSTKTQHLFRNPPFMQTLSASSNKICWRIARNIHLITSHASAALECDTRCGKGWIGCKNGSRGRSGLCRHGDMWSWAQSDRPVCAVERCRCGLHLPANGPISLQRMSSSLPTETVAKVFLLPSGMGGFNLFSVCLSGLPTRRRYLENAGLLTNLLLKTQRTRHLFSARSLSEVALDLKTWPRPPPDLQYTIWSLLGCLEPKSRCSGR